MDDFSQLLGVQLRDDQIASLKEMARQANDRLRVYNPTDDDYYVAWDLAGSGGRFLVPSKNKDVGYGAGQAVHARYICFKYFKEMSNKILGERLKDAIEKENNDRMAKGFKAMDKSFDSQEELRFSGPYLVNNSDRLQELLPVLILGVEEEYGLDTQPVQKTEAQINWDKINSLVNRPARRPEEAPQAAPIPSETPAPQTETTPDTQGLLQELQG